MKFPQTKTKVIYSINWASVNSKWMTFYNKQFCDKNKLFLKRLNVKELTWEEFWH
jgi:hypothetical protein